MDILIPLLVALTLTVMVGILFPSKPKHISQAQDDGMDEYLDVRLRVREFHDCDHCKTPYKCGESSANVQDRYCSRRCEELDQGDCK